MEKINFVNGQVPALNKTNLNKMQENTEKAINDVDAKVGALDKRTKTAEETIAKLQAENSELKGFIVNNSRDMTASGTNINVKDSSDYEAELVVDGKAEQVHTTQSSNLADVNVLYEEMKAFDSTYVSEETVDNKECIKFLNTKFRYDAGFEGLSDIDYKENTTYTVRGLFRVYDTTVTSGHTLWMNICYTDGTRDSVGTPAVGETWIELRKVSNATKTVLCIYFTYDTGAYWYLDKDSFGIYEGNVTEYTAFVPYIPSPQYPSPISVIEDSVEVRTCAKNLITFPYHQESKTVNGVTFTVNEDGTILINGTATGGGMFVLNNGTGEIVLNEGKTYCLSGLTGGSISTYYVQVFVNFSSSVGNMYTKPIFMTFNKTYIGARLVFFFKTGAVFNNLLFKPQLEIYDNATVYEPYKEDKKTIDLQGNFMASLPNGTKDVLSIDKNGNVKLSKRVGKTIVTETSQIYYETTFTNVTRFRIENVVNASEVAIAGLSSHFVHNRNYTLDSEHFYYTLSGHVYLFISNSIATTIDELKTWLANNPITFYYELVEPYEVDLGTLEAPLKTFRTVTNVSNSASTNMILNYKKDLQTQLAEIEALLSANVQVASVEETTEENTTKEEE